MPLRNLAWLFIVPGLVTLGLVLCASAPPPDADYDRVRRVVEVMAEVDVSFYRKLTPEEWRQFTEDMINGGLRRLDPHSEYFNEEQLQQFEAENEGSYGGVGIIMTVDPVSRLLRVDSLFPGSPAYEAGIIANDLITQVGELSTEGMSVSEARKLITGEPGTQVTLTIRRAGRNPADQPVVLTRARIPQHPISGIRRLPNDPNRWEWFVDRANGIGYIRIIAFNDLTSKELKAAVDDIVRNGGRALILDLRDNPGGLLNQAIEVANLFLPAGAPIVSTRGRDAEKGRNFVAEGGREIFQPAEQRPIVVLINDQSASASEIVASALQDNKRATIVGERSYGKGSVQKLLRLQFGQEKAGVKLTTETYWRPNGQNMDRRLAPKDRPDEWGVRPDIEVPLTAIEKDQVSWEFYKAMWVAGKPAVVGPNPPSPPLKPPGSFIAGLRELIHPDAKSPTNGRFEDRQLTTAIELLKNKLRGH